MQPLKPLGRSARTQFQRCDRGKPQNKRLDQQRKRLLLPQPEFCQAWSEFLSFGPFLCWE